MRGGATTMVKENIGQAGGVEAVLGCQKGPLDTLPAGARAFP